ncbi:hypothetical protein ACTHGU_00250 [Chitinophagaceae bacterium MMS25-I14]
MKLNFTKYVVPACLAFLLNSCAPSPREYFEQSALSVNSLSAFGKSELENLLYQKGTVYDYETKKYKKADTFKEQIKDNLKVNEDLYDKMKTLEETDDNREMVESAKKVFEFALSKYHSDYIRIADLKDKNEPQSVIDSAIRKFDQDNIAQFNALRHEAVNAGMGYAKKHNLNVTQVNL